MAHSPHANILEHARLQPGSSHVARRADAYLIALVSRSAAMRTWENHADVIAPPLGFLPRQVAWHEMTTVSRRVVRGAGAKTP